MGACDLPGTHGENELRSGAAHLGTVHPAKVTFFGASESWSGRSQEGSSRLARSAVGDGVRTTDASGAVGREHGVQGGVGGVR
jgi:hypothetical protein